MPEIIQISDYSMTRGKRPRRMLGTSPKMAEADSAAVRRMASMIRKAKIVKAAGGIQLAMLALASARFEEAADLAVYAAIEAAFAFKEDPKTATRVIVTARGIVRNAVRGVMARSV